MGSEGNITFPGINVEMCIQNTELLDFEYRLELETIQGRNLTS